MKAYWGHVNPIGQELAMMKVRELPKLSGFAYKNHSNVSIRIARIFNTYGPFMNVNDGRVVSNGVQAINNKPLTIYEVVSKLAAFVMWTI